MHAVRAVCDMHNYQLIVIKYFTTCLPEYKSLICLVEKQNQANQQHSRYINACVVRTPSVHGNVIAQQHNPPYAYYRESFQLNNDEYNGFNILCYYCYKHLQGSSESTRVGEK